MWCRSVAGAAQPCHAHTPSVGLSRRAWARAVSPRLGAGRIARRVAPEHRIAPVLGAVGGGQLGQQVLAPPRLNGALEPHTTDAAVERGAVPGERRLTAQAAPLLGRERARWPAWRRDGDGRGIGILGLCYHKVNSLVGGLSWRVASCFLRAGDSPFSLSPTP